MDTKRIQNLREIIENFIENGGDIYSPRRELPYYERLRGIKRDLDREEEREVSYEEVYAMCGITFDRDFNSFMKFYERVCGFADENGYVDSMRKNEVRAVDNTYEQLENYADRYGCSPFDFLVLMTGFKFKRATIQVDYVSYLSQELLKAYPDGNIEGIRWERPDLYEKIRHLRKYMPESASMQDVAEILGVYNERFSIKKYEANLDKNALLQKLYELCPDKNATKLREIDITTYHGVITLARSEDKTPFQWLSENNFRYDFELNMPRLSQVKVNIEERVNMLLSLREELLNGYNLEGIDDITRFHINLEVMHRVLQRVNGEDLEFVGIEEITPLGETSTTPTDGEEK